MSNDTWKDPRTGLEWQVEPAKKRMDWDDAKEHADNLYLNSDGWRLPTKEELATISGENRPRELSGKGWFWSSSPVEGSDGFAWVVVFCSGRVGYGVGYGDRYGDRYVRCVRGEQAGTQEPTKMSREELEERAQKYGYNGLFADRDSIGSALHFAQQLIESLPPKHRAAAYTAMYVVHNTHCLQRAAKETK